jgi:hypothetical protein
VTSWVAAGKLMLLTVLFLVPRLLKQQSFLVLKLTLLK